MPSLFQSVVEAQIRAAEERGAFDNLPGAGKPIPGLMEPDDHMWWLKGFIEREKLPTDALLPPGLLLRREIERLPATVAPLRSEQAVRDHVEDLNHRIRRWIQIPVGPQVVVRPVDPEEVLAFWREVRQPPPRPEPTPEPAPARRARWWHRRRARRSTAAG